MSSYKNQSVDAPTLTVSVCVMSYNLEKYIAEALDSILIQKVNFKYEIVVGDDFSTDKTREILQVYARKHPSIFKLLLHKCNLGMLANFAQTLKQCRGKYIAILDGDDYWIDPLKLQKQVGFLETHSDYSMVFHNAELHDYTQDKVTIRRFNSDNESRAYTVNEILETWSVTTCSVLCVNNEQYRYIEKNLWFPVQDLPFYLCCATMGKIYYLADTMCVYRKLSTGSQNSEEFKSVNIHLTSIKYLNKLYDDFSDILSKESIARVSSVHYEHAAYKSNQIGNQQDFLKYLVLAMSQDPEYIYETVILAEQVRIQKNADIKFDALNDSYNQLNIKFDALKDSHNHLMRQISGITKQHTWKNPIKKIQSYKAMLKTYYKLQASEDDEV